MKISTKGRYAIRCMLDLAMNDTGEAIKLNQIAKRQNISEKYLEQIVAVLTKAGFLISIRGSQGGYRLTKKPEDITVGMILRVIEGNLAPVDFLVTGSSDELETASTIQFYTELYNAINTVLDKYTLAMLVDIERTQVLDFCI